MTITQAVERQRGRTVRLSDHFAKVSARYRTLRGAGSATFAVDPGRRRVDVSSATWWLAPWTQGDPCGSWTSPRVRGGTWTRSTLRYDGSSPGRGPSKRSRSGPPAGRGPGVHHFDLAVCWRGVIGDRRLRGRLDHRSLSSCHAGRFHRPGSESAHAQASAHPQQTRGSAYAAPGRGRRNAPVPGLQL